jgi:ubiquinone/menaquinone biosynthesis C-methylase UbiE
LSNSHRVISALVSADFLNDPRSSQGPHIFDIQGYLLQLTERVKDKFSENKNKCETFGRYPATLSQIMAIKQLGGLQNLKNLIKKKFREIKDNDLDAFLRLDDDLVIYNEMKKISNIVNKNKKKEDPVEVDRYRANARLRELNEFLNYISKKYMNKSSFAYLDYGGGEGGISKAIAEKLRLNKNNSFSLDVEDWYGNITEKRYQQYITYRTIKPFTALPFEDESINLITSLQVLHHIPNLDYYMNELVRILKPGGYLVVREHDCNSELVRRLIDVEHMLFECVLNTGDQGNGRYLFEYKDSDNYKSIDEWISYISNNGLQLLQGFDDLYKRVDQETRYVYRIFRKPEVLQ